MSICIVLSLPRGPGAAATEAVQVCRAMRQHAFVTQLCCLSRVSPVLCCMQLVRPEQGMRCVGECVHQDYSRGCRIINAWQAEGTQWTLTGESSPLTMRCPL